MPKLACCGNDCGCCPRYTAAQSGDIQGLKKAAEIWWQVGWREALAAPEEMACSGCATVEWCRYGIKDCAQRLGVVNCGQCPHYPCPRLEEALARSAAYAARCQEICSPRQYAVLAKAFFNKQENLERSARG